MRRDMTEPVFKELHPASTLMWLLISPYESLIEIDVDRRAARYLCHSEGKFFTPLLEGGHEDLLEYALENMVHPDDREAYRAFNDIDTFLERIERSETPGEIRLRYRHRLLSGGWRWTDRIVAGGKHFGLPPGIVYVFVFDTENLSGANTGADGTLELRRSELTGLLRSDTFFEQGRELVSAHPEGWCLLVFDIEQFKLFNDWYGRAQGNLLLARMGACLARKEEETGGLAGYFGQDDFALLAPYDREMIERLYEEVHTLIMAQGASVGFLPAFGVCPLDGESAIEDLCDRAAAAARRAKEYYHSRIRVFEPYMYEQTDRDYRLLSDFQKALGEHELFIVLQPQCVIETGKVVGAESLVRWKRADGSMVSPGIFVPVLERYGFVTDMDKYVWEEVCAWQKRWIDGGHTPVPISVNVSQIDIFTVDVPDYLEQLVKKYSLPEGVIKVEITESAYVDDAGVVDAVRRLREKGFVVLMDDFGSGYSSLNMLRNLNVDIIKLDAKFLRMNSEDNKKGVQIMESVVNLARTMGAPVIVEGVETQEETDFLVSLGCRYVQGYHFFKPMPTADFEALIADPERIDTHGFRFVSKEQFHIREFLDRNVFSDAMLNSVLGPVAFFLWHGEDVDTVRFNRQFRDEVQIGRLDDYLGASQRLVAPEDRPLLYGLLSQAYRDPLGGASGVLRIDRQDGTAVQLQMNIYFLKEDGEGKRFYASARNVTQMMEFSEQLRLLSRLSADTVAFLFRSGESWRALVTTHGLEEYLGMDREQLERELNDHSFHRRIAPGERAALRRTILDAGVRMENYTAPFAFTAPDGRQLKLRVRFGAVRDRTSGAEYIMVLRKGANTGENTAAARAKNK